MTLLALENVGRSFLDGAREIVVLDDVSVAFDAKELIGIYGGRRSGKSTLLKIAAGLESVDRGTVSFRGQNIATLSFSKGAQLRRRYGLAFVSGDWRPERMGEPVIEHVAIPLTSDGMTLAEAESPARSVLRQFGVMQWAHIAIDRLSASERIRVELARAVVREPSVLLVDEPAILSSPSESRDLYALLHALAKNMTVVIASENIDAVSGVDRFMTLGGSGETASESR